MERVKQMEWIRWKMFYSYNWLGWKLSELSDKFYQKAIVYHEKTTG